MILRMYIRYEEFPGRYYYDRKLKQFPWGELRHCSMEQLDSILTDASIK